MGIAKSKKRRKTARRYFVPAQHHHRVCGPPKMVSDGENKMYADWTIISVSGLVPSRQRKGYAPVRKTPSQKDDQVSFSLGGVRATPAARAVNIRRKIVNTLRGRPAGALSSNWGK